MHYTAVNNRAISSDEAKVVIQNILNQNRTGLLETILVCDEEIRLWNYHQERLLNGAKALGIGSINFQLFEDEILNLLHRNNISPLARVRLQVFPNLADQNFQFTIETSRVLPEVTRYNTKGLCLGIFNEKRKTRNTTANLKTTERHLYNQAQATAERNGWDDAIILNDKLHPVETTIANLYWTKESIIYTPPLSEGCVAGVMRLHLLAELANFGYDIQECSLTEYELLNADEVFISNAIRGIKWVAAVGSSRYSNELSFKLASLLFT